METWSHRMEGMWPILPLAIYLEDRNFSVNVTELCWVDEQGMTGVSTMHIIQSLNSPWKFYYFTKKKKREQNESPGRDGQLSTPPSQQAHMGLHEPLHTHWPILSSQQTEGVISLSALLDRENQGTQRQNSESTALPYYSVLPPWWKLFING